jgi:hypothetical protein
VSRSKLTIPPISSVSTATVFAHLQPYAGSSAGKTYVAFATPSNVTRSGISVSTMPLCCRMQSDEKRPGPGTSARPHCAVRWPTALETLSADGEDPMKLCPPVWPGVARDPDREGEPVAPRIKGGEPEVQRQLSRDCLYPQPV